MTVDLSGKILAYLDPAAVIEDDLGADQPVVAVPWLVRVCGSWPKRVAFNSISSARHRRRAPTRRPLPRWT